MTSIESVTLEVSDPTDASASSSWRSTGRPALAKDVGVSADGTGSHRIVIGSDAGPFTDPDSFAWEAASV